MLPKLPRWTWTIALLTSLVVLLFSPIGKRIFAQSGSSSLFPNARRDFLVPDAQPNRLASADFDGDGKPDLIASCGSTKPFTSHIFKGLGNGSYVDQGTTPLGGAVAIGDFNNDGKLDLVSSEVGIALGLGNGTFQPALMNPIPDARCTLSSDIISVGDFNKDGKLDVAVASNNGLYVLLGRGDGTLSSPVLYSLDEAKAIALVAGDLDGDGNLDLIVATTSTVNRVYVLLGTPTGAFVVSQNFNSCPVRSLAVSDLNRDGGLDVAAVCYGFTNSLQLYFGSGTGTFIGLLPVNPLNVYAWSVRAADLNHDGIDDLVVAGGDANAAFGQASVLIGRGDGTFLAPVPYTLPAYTFPQGIVIADADGNGTLDLAIGNKTGRQLGGYFTTLSGVGNGTFVQPTRITGVNNSQGVVAGDYNLDGNPDFAVANYGTGDVSVFLGNGNGTFQTAAHYATGAGTSGIVSGDFNKDGKLDLAVTNQYDDTLQILTGIGNGLFVSGARYTLADNFYPSSIASGDFNSDGKLDLVVEGAGQLTVFPGNGDGTFLIGVTLSGLGQAYTSFLARYLNSVAVGDFNRDGKLDIAATSYGVYDGVTIFTGNGNFTFRIDSATYILPSFPSYVVAADFNGDGNLDLAIASQNNDVVSVLIGLGNGRFQRHVDYRVGFMPVYMAVADFNKDGKIDVATANLFSSNVSILLGSGTGTFSPAVEFGTHGAFALAAGDWNKDNTPDLMSVGNTWVTPLIGITPPTEGRKVRGQLISD
jgi:hypothetical protein